jgi:hypothetical protein
MSNRTRADNSMSNRTRADNTMSNRTRTDNTMSNRTRTDNTMSNRTKTKRQTIVDKKLHRKVNREQHEPILKKEECELWCFKG